MAEIFKITKEHIKLLQRFCVDWDDCEFGAPRINPKRPYGNSDVIQDMIEILGLKTLKEGIYEFKLGGRTWLLKGSDEYNLYLEGADEDELCNILTKLHKDMKTVLQIILNTKSFRIGNYINKEEYGDDWEYKGKLNG